MTYQIVGLGPLIVSSLHIAVLGTLRCMSADAFSVDGWIGSGAIEIGHAHTTLVLRFQALYTSARGLIEVTRTAHLLEILLIDENSRIGLDHVCLIHGQHETIFGHREYSLACTVSRERCFEDAHAFFAASFIRGAALAHCLVFDAAASLVAVHPEVAF